MKKIRVLGVISLLLLICFTSCNRLDPPTEPFVITKCIYRDVGYTEYVFACAANLGYTGRFKSSEIYCVGDTICFTYLTDRTPPHPIVEPKDESNKNQ